MEQVVNFDVDVSKDVTWDDYSNDEFAIAKMGFLSTRPNSHKLVISEDVLKECAKTVLNKWVVADMQFGDMTTHTKNEHIVGKIPKEQDVVFVEDDDGYLRAYVDTVISKIYAKDFCEAFANQNERAVSVEMKVTTNGEDDNEVLSFNIVGVTVLGKAVKPSCPESDITFVRFSTREANKFFKSRNGEKTLDDLKTFVESRTFDEKKSDENDSVISKAEDNNTNLSFDKDNEGKEEMAVEEEKIVEETKEELSEPETDVVEKMGDESEPEESHDDDDDDDDDDDNEEKEAEMSCEALQSKIDELMASIAEKDNIIMECNKELEELRKFKCGVEEKEKAMAVESIMAEVKDCLTDAQFAECRTNGLSCQKDEIDAWSNGVKAIAFASIKKRPAKKDDSDVFTFGAPVESEQKEPSDIWERLKNLY